MHLQITNRRLVFALGFTAISFLASSVDTRCFPVHPLAPYNSDSGRDSVIQTASIVEYQNRALGYLFTYDSSRFSVRPWSDGEGLEIVRDGVFILEVSRVEDRWLPSNVPPDSETLIALRRTTLLPDTLLAAVFLRVVSTCAAGGTDSDDRLAMPPRKLVRLINKNGVRYLKFWSYFEIGWYDKPVERIPVGPLYLMDLSTPNRTLFLEMKYDCSRAAPSWLEALMDSIAESIQNRGK